MLWFLERISIGSLPIHFGFKESWQHSKDFLKLKELRVLRQSPPLDSVECDLCEEPHECQVRFNEGETYYVCENGSGRRQLADEELMVFEYDNDAFLRLLAAELGLKADASSSKDLGAYSDDALFMLGTYEDEDQMLKIEVYYLRNRDYFEPSMYFEERGNAPKILITNTEGADLVLGKEQLTACVLSNILSQRPGKGLFRKGGFKRSLKTVRRVRFDEKEGHLFLDDKRIFTASLNGPHYHFLSYLWEKWMQQVPYSDIYVFVRKKTGSKVSDAPEQFCQKMKSQIKKSCPSITGMITTPTVGYYMMADPR